MKGEMENHWELNAEYWVKNCNFVRYQELNMYSRSLAI